MRSKLVRLNMISLHKADLYILGVYMLQNNLGTTLRQRIVTNMVKKKVM